MVLTKQDEGAWQVLLQLLLLSYLLAYKHPLLTDSKKLTAKQRKEIRKEIEHIAISFAIAHVMPERIDEINILNASIEAMHLAIEKLDTTPTFILVDGNRFKPYFKIPHKCKIKGDARYLNIAAASVLAKTERDEFMTKLHSSLSSLPLGYKQGVSNQKTSKRNPVEWNLQMAQKKFYIIANTNPIQFLTLLHL